MMNNWHQNWQLNGGPNLNTNTTVLLIYANIAAICNSILFLYMTANKSQVCRRIPECLTRFSPWQMYCVRLNIVPLGIRRRSQMKWMKTQYSTTSKSNNIITLACPSEENQTNNTFESYIAQKSYCCALDFDRVHQSSYKLLGGKVISTYILGRLCG